MSAIIALARSRPFAFGMGYSLLKTAGCDLMVQKVVEKRESIDWKRNAAFASFGLFYLGGVQYFLYVPVFSRIFPTAGSFATKSIAEKLKDPVGIRNVFLQVFLDQMVHHPIMYFPVFYMIKDFVTSDKPDPVRAVGEYRTNMSEDLIALWKVWIPSTFLNFSLMPMWGRIPWVASTSLIWTCILSAMRGGSDVPATNVYSQVDSTSMELITRTVVGPAPRLDPSQGHLLVFVRGTDRPGIISNLTKRLYDHGGSITTSKMMSLGPEFAVILHVCCGHDQLAALKQDLCPARGGAAAASQEMAAHTHADGVQVMVRELDPSAAAAASAPLPLFTGKVWLTGVDKPGLLYHLSQTLADFDLSIEHLQTEQHHQSHPEAPHFFSTHCHVVSSSQPDMAALKRALKQLERDLNVVCSIEAVEVMK